MLGMLLIVGSGFFAGYMASKGLKDRLDALLEIERLLILFKAEIAFSSRTVAQIISRSQTGIARAAERSGDFMKEPLEALRKSAGQVIKNREDRELFLDFISGLGGADVTGQLEHIELYERLFKPQIEIAREDCEKKRKLFVCMGLFSGITVSAVLA